MHVNNALDYLSDLIFIVRINNLYEMVYRIDEEETSVADLNERRYQTLCIP